jgi:hypothetical protein
MHKVDERFDETGSSLFTPNRNSRIMVWLRKGQIIHSYVSQLKDTGNVFNTTLFKSSSDVAIFKDEDKIIAFFNGK